MVLRFMTFWKELKMERRNFLKGLAGVVAVATGVTSLKAEDSTVVVSRGIEKIPLTELEVLEYRYKQMLLNSNYGKPKYMFGHQHAPYNISNVRVINHALSPEEVEANFEGASLYFNELGEVVSKC